MKSLHNPGRFIFYIAKLLACFFCLPAKIKKSGILPISSISGIIRVLFLKFFLKIGCYRISQEAVKSIIPRKITTSTLDNYGRGTDVKLRDILSRFFVIVFNWLSMRAILVWSLVLSGGFCCKAVCNSARCFNSVVCC